MFLNGLLVVLCAFDMFKKLVYLNQVLFFYYFSLFLFSFFCIARLLDSLFSDFLNPSGSSIMASAVQQVWINQDGTFNNLFDFDLFIFMFFEHISPTSLISELLNSTNVWRL
jgi:hypothetical protein